MGDSDLDSMELDADIAGSILPGRNFRPSNGGLAGAARAVFTASPPENQSHPHQQTVPAVEAHQMVQDAVAPILLELKKMQKENKQQGMKIESMKNQLAMTYAMGKEMKETVDKEKKPLKSLLKPEGVELFKKKVWQSMHLNAEMQEEQEVWAELVRNLREFDQLISDSARDFGNLLKCFHEERSVLKQQVPDRMNKDFCNKTVESAVALTKTFNYLNTRGLGRLDGADLLFLYQLGQYLNEKMPVLDSSSKAIRARAEKNLWEVVHKKAEKSTNNVEEMKLKIKNSMKNGFMPL